MGKDNRLTSDDGVYGLLKILNKLALVACWIAIVLDITYCISTNNIFKSLIFAFFTPIRYFLFDIDASKIIKRPPSLDRNIPLYIFLRYWNSSFPIPQGNILSDIAGFFLASCRIFINGYGLLYFDTFTFLYKVKNDENGIPLDQDIRILHDNAKIQNIEAEATTAQSGIEAEHLNKIAEEWKKVAISNDLDIWNFPLKRYMGKSKFIYFQNNEIGHFWIDDRYLIDQEKFLKDHPESKEYYQKSNV